MVHSSVLFQGKSSTNFSVLNLWSVVKLLGHVNTAATSLVKINALFSVLFLVYRVITRIESFYVFFSNYM
jgi:hypothetical protein